MRRFAAAVMVGGLALIGAVGTATAQEKAAPSVTVTPDGALQDGDTIQVTGTGFEPGSEVFLMLCNDDERLGDEIARCGLIGTGAEGYVVADDGSVGPALIVVPVGQVGASDIATCPPSRAQSVRGISCSVQVAGNDLAFVAGESVTYAGEETGNVGALAFTGLRGEAYVAPALTVISVGIFLQLAAAEVRRRAALAS